MRDNGTPASELIAAWRAQHAERLDPRRLRFIEALALRTDAHHGQARHLLEEKLSALLDAYDADLARMPATACDADADAAPAATAPARSPLGELLDRFAGNAANDAANAMPSHSAQLPALDDARKLWTALRSRSQLRQSLQQAPSGAGPLNSGVLVQRSLALMRTLSPGYLQHFLSYVDALSWLQQMHDDDVLATQQKPGAAVGKKPTRSKPRKRG